MNCQICGEILIKHQKMVCSKKCQGVYFSLKYKGKAKDPITLQCIDCKDDMTAYSTSKKDVLVAKKKRGEKTPIFII